jgi:hypothetical protein
MANALTAFSPTYWSAQIQKKLYKKNIFRAIASFAEQKTLTNGQTVNRPYRSDVYAQNYTKGTALTAQDVSGTQESLTVNQIKAMLIYIDNIDKIQNKWALANYYIDEATTRLGNIIDATLLGETQNANQTLTDGDMGGTAGNGIILTTSNILNVFGKANRKLDANNVPLDSRFAVISPQFKDVLWQYIGGRESILGDKTGENNNIGSYAGFQLYLSNNLYATATLAGGANPTAADTITIAGAGFSAITFTFVSTIGAAAGNILIGGSTNATWLNLVALITANGVGDGVNNVSLSAANQAVVTGWTAAAVTTSFNLTALGASYFTLTSSNASNVWTTTAQLQHMMFGAKMATDMVIQKEPDVEIASTVAAGKYGVNILPLTLFGVKTFNYGTKLLVDVKINSSVF